MTADKISSSNCWYRAMMRSADGSYCCRIKMHRRQINRLHPAVRATSATPLLHHIQSTMTTAAPASRHEPVPFAGGVEIPCLCLPEPHHRTCRIPLPALCGGLRNNPDSTEIRTAIVPERLASCPECRSLAQRNAAYCF